MATLPVVDLAPFWENKGITIGEEPTPDQLRVAAEIDRANMEYGFLGAKNFGITKDEVETYVSAAKELFDLPLEYKEEKLSPDGIVNMGYVSPKRNEVHHDGFQAEKEAFKISESTDFKNCPAQFTQSSKELFSRLADMKRRYSLATALALGVNPEAISQIHQTPEFTSIRYNHYSPVNAHETLEKPIIRLGAHTDFGTNTFLLLHRGANGLEVKPSGLQEWIEVKLPTDVHCVVNIGDMWETMTNGRWKATRHRVMLCNEEQKATDRYSIACFLNPEGDTKIAPLPELLEKNTIPAYKPFVAREYFNGLLAKTITSSYVMEEKESD